MKRNYIQRIRLNSIDDRVGTHNKIQKKIREQISKSIWLDHRPHILVFHALSIFNFKKGKYNIGNVPSIEKACVEILTLSGLYQHGKLEPTFKRKDDTADYDPINHFITFIIGFYKLPFFILLEMEKAVKSDLNILLSLIQEYESDPIIIELLEENRYRGEHTAKTKVDFYKRCLQERDVIVKFIANGIEERAIKKATNDPTWNHIGIFWSDTLIDKPYKWWAFRTMEYFDYRKINVTRHRLEEVVIGKAKKLSVLYKKGHKIQFYNQLKKTVSPPQIFDGILNYYIKILPAIADREPIFKELRALFSSRKWYGFTALALTQVEGLFSVMTNIVPVKGKVSSLSTKVNAMRPHFEREEQSFDYFEYYLPGHRNRFLHFGQIKNEIFKTLAYDLLYDLHYLMSVFHRLKDPHVELHLLVKKDPVDIIHGLGSFVKLFRLVKTIQDRAKTSPKDVHVKAVLEDWKKFEKEVLSPSSMVEYYLLNTDADLDGKMKDFFDYTKMHTANTGNEVDLEQLSVPELMKKKDLVIQAISESLFHDFDSYECIVECSVFLKDYKTYLPNHSKDAQAISDAIHSRHKDNFKKLVAINAALFPDNDKRKKN